MNGTLFNVWFGLVCCDFLKCLVLIMEVGILLFSHYNAN